MRRSFPRGRIMRSTFSRELPDRHAVRRQWVFRFAGGFLRLIAFLSGHSVPPGGYARRPGEDGSVRTAELWRALFESRFSASVGGMQPSGVDAGVCVEFDGGTIGAAELPVGVADWTSVSRSLDAELKRERDRQCGDRAGRDGRRDHGAVGRSDAPDHRRRRLFRAVRVRAAG